MVGHLEPQLLDVALMIRHALAVVMVLSAVGALPSSASADPVEIDDDHHLATENGIAEWKSNGSATARNVGGFGLSITIAEDHDDVGLSGAHTDFDHTWLRIKYSETIERTIRVYIPDDYWHPYPKDGLESESGQVELSMRPIENVSMSAVTVHLSGPTDAVWGIQRAASTVYSARDRGKSFVENVTGFDLPTLSTSTQWEYIGSEDFGQNRSTVAIDTNGSDTMIQFNKGSERDQHWVPVPKCSKTSASEAPVCRFSKAGDDRRVYILSRVVTNSTDTPTVRYASDTGPLAGVRSAINDLERIARDIPKRIRGLFGWI